ncbi:MAG: hypothetical protein PHI99_00060 [Syntrophales bacterium]|nr:hypothetical protein [Syntrophales bacterium]
MSLKYIAEDDHVLVRQVNLFGKSEEELLNFKRLSVHEALTFPGFCNRHDNDLFISLDRSPFIASPEQLFMQAYRCDCRELYFKLCQTQASLDAVQIAELQGLPPDNKYKLSPELEVIKAGMYRSLGDGIASKEKFERYLINGDYRQLQSFIVHARCSPTIASAGAFFPDVLSSCEIIQDFTDFESNLQSIFLSFIPEQSGIFVVFSFFYDEAKAPTKFINDLIRTDNLPARLVWLCLTRLENTALKPSWWETLPYNIRQSINQAVQYNADVFDNRLPTFDRMPNMSFPDWEIVHKFWI